MQRVWDYIGFASCFAGFGYVVLWLVGSPEHLALPSAAHVLGIAVAALVSARVIMGIVRRRHAASAVLPAAPAKPAATLRPRRKATYPIRKVKPRSHFGMRGTPH